VSVSGNPTSAAVDAAGKFLYVTNLVSGAVSAYTIGSASGAALTPVAGAPFAADSGPISVTVDPSGKFAYVGNQNSNDVSAFTIGVAGALTTVAGSPFATDTTPRSVVVDRSGKYLYVVTGAGTISPTGALSFKMNANLSGGAVSGVTQLAGIGGGKNLGRCC
jgi:DNA-binding beta-propeller fold protein YncE